jgi:hypothetical protein
VQWNGAAPNAGPGPVLRNIGEVLGVFGHLKITPRRALPPVYRDTSVDVTSLKQLEVLVGKLESPVWPAAFAPIDRAKAAPGNSNAGHPYGTQLIDDEKRQLIEYLKTL